MSFWRKATKKHRRNSRAALVVILALASLSPVQCDSMVIVEAPAPISHVTQKMRIKVLFDGKPLERAKIEMQRWNRPDVFVALTTDASGEVVIPVVPPGAYRIGVSSDPYPEGIDVCIGHCPDNPFEVEELVIEDLNGRLKSIDELPGEPTHLTIEIGPLRFVQNSELLSKAEREPITSQMSELRGVVQDQSGAVIPWASIVVVVKGTNGERHAATLRSNSAGTFTAKLPTGEYVVLISSPGFISKAVPISIMANGQSGELRIVLRVGEASQATTIVTAQ